VKDKVIILAKILDNITFKLNGLSGICICIITIFILAEIIARKFFNYGFLFVLEVSSYLLATSWFLSAAYTLRTDGHIRINVLTSVLKTDRAARFVDIFATVLGIVISLIFFRAVLILTSDSYFFNKTSFSPLRAPLYIPQTFIAIGMFFMLIQMIVRLMLLLINEKPDINLKNK
jgi:TRAP-type C4-dicarboxylate transport system permease small subunit